MLRGRRYTKDSPEGSHGSSEQGVTGGGAREGRASHLPAHSLPFLGMPDPQELLTTCHLPSEEDVGRSFQVGSPLSIRAGWVRNLPEGWNCPLFQLGPFGRQQALGTGIELAVGPLSLPRALGHQFCFRSLQCQRDCVEPNWRFLSVYFIATNSMSNWNPNWLK